MAWYKSKSLCDFATVVTTYADLGRFCRAFAKGHLNLFVVVGLPGTGKSRAMKDAVGDNCCWLTASATAFGLYKEAYRHRDEKIIIDDVDELYRDPLGTRLLKALAQTDPSKRVCWHTDAPSLAREEIPREFVTTSHVAIIANEWHTANANVAALKDRGHVVNFVPTALAVHQRAATFFWDQTVYDFVAEHLHLIREPSLRTYVLAAERKRAGLDWKQAVLERCVSGNSLIVAKLRGDKRFATEEDRVRAFVDGKHGCRATYFNIARKLRPAEAAPKIVLKFDITGGRKAWPGDRTAVVLDILRGRRRLSQINAWYG